LPHARHPYVAVRIRSTILPPNTARDNATEGGGAETGAAGAERTDFDIAENKNAGDLLSAPENSERVDWMRGRTGRFAGTEVVATGAKNLEESDKPDNLEELDKPDARAGWAESTADIRTALRVKFIWRKFNGMVMRIFG
jgi:hypothetical protein